MDAKKPVNGRTGAGFGRGVLAQAEALIRRCGAWTARHRRLVMAAAIGLIAIGLVWTRSAHPDLLTTVDLAALAWLVILYMPAMLLLSALQFIVMGQVMGVAVGLAQALRVTVVATAANVLPVPGTILSRVAVLTAGGAPAAGATRLMLLDGIMWLGMTMVMGGMALMAMQSALLGAAFLVPGAGVVAFCLMGIRPVGDGEARLRGRVLLLVARVAIVALDAWRIAVALGAVGLATSFGDALVFSMASALGAAAALVAVGIGVREALMGLLAPIVGIEATLGFAAAVVLRVAELMAVGALAAGLWLTRPRGVGR